MSKLNRFLVLNSLESNFPFAKSNALGRYSSNHTTILLHTKSAFTEHRPFRLDAMWIEKGSVLDIIRQAWISTGVRGWSCYRIWKKVMVVKQKLLQCKKDNTIVLRIGLRRQVSRIRDIDVEVENHELVFLELATERIYLINSMHDLMRLVEVYWRGLELNG
ncbi:hypothetical protein AMTRI_Chr07g27100 [Amborella trichopoda]